MIFGKVHGPLNPRPRHTRNGKQMKEKGPTEQTHQNQIWAHAGPKKEISGHRVKGSIAYASAEAQLTKAISRPRFRTSPKPAVDRAITLAVCTNLGVP